MRAELTIEIERPVDDVFAYLTDVSNLPEWQSGVEEAHVEGGELGAGGRVVERRRLLGRTMKHELEVTAYEPPRVFALRASGGPVAFEVTHTLDDVAGRTRLRVDGDIDSAALPGFMLGIAAKRAEKQFRSDFERLKRVLEAR